MRDGFLHLLSSSLSPLFAESFSRACRLAMIQGSLESLTFQQNLQYWKLEIS